MASPSLLEQLQEQNPWWRSGTIAGDRNLRALEQMPFQREPTVLDDLDLSQPNVYTLRGPRQVGKTTACKLLIGKLLERGVPPTRILYYSLDLESDPQAIIEILRAAKRRHPQPDGRWHVILDEISSVPDWQKAIKWLRDQTDAVDDFLLLTGSIASDIRRGSELLPGRRGPGTHLDKLLLPLSFSEFCLARQPDLQPERKLTLLELMAPNEEISELLFRAQFRAADLDELLRQYASIGGFPAAVGDLLREGQVTERTVSVIWSLISGDLIRLGRDSQLAARLLDRMRISLGTPISWKTLATELDAATETAQEYARHLEEAFISVILYAWDTARAMPARRKGKKLYAFDPLFLEVPGLIQASTRRISLPAVIENLVGMGIYRTAEAPHLEAIYLPRTLYYWRSSKGREVDFYVRRQRAEMPVEVRYQEKVQPGDAQVMRSAFGRGLLISRQSFSAEGPIPILPAGVFLWLLREGEG